MWTECEAPRLGRLRRRHDVARALTRPPYENHRLQQSGLLALLGGIIEAVSGRVAGRIICRRNVLDPLGMSETRPVPEADDPLLATGYTREKDGYQRDALPFWLMKGFEASANFASSVNDWSSTPAFIWA